MNDVLVIGGGAIGVSCALYLARAGARVTLLESGPELGAGCSAGNAGLLCPSHAAPLATRASLLQGLRWSLTPDGPFALRLRPSLVPWLARLELHDRLREEVGAHLERTGTLNVYETEAVLAHGRREAAEHAQSGLRSQILTSSEASELEPALAGPVAGAIFYRDELSGDPLDFVRVVGRAAAEAGAEIRTHTEVLSLRNDRGRIAHVETTAGRLAVDTVVLAAGAWSPRVAHGLGLDIPVEGGKGYHVDYVAADGDPRVPIFLQEARVIATRMPGRLRLSGTLELAGLDLSVDERRVTAIERAGLRRVRGLEGRRRLEVWRGLRPCTPDGLPLIGRTARYDNLMLATGHAALGFTLAPITGSVITQIVAGKQPEQDVALLQPNRFHALVRIRAGRHA